MALVDHVSLFESIPLEGDVHNFRSSHSSLSPAKRRQRIIQEQLEAAQERVAKEASRHKLLLDDTALFPFRSPGYYVKQAKEKYQRRTRSSVSSGRTSPFRNRISISTSQRRSQGESFLQEPIKDILPASLSHLPEGIIPTWVSQRQDFHLAYIKIKASRVSDVEAICRKDGTARTPYEKLGLLKWAEETGLGKRPMELLDRLQTVVMKEQEELAEIKALIILLRGEVQVVTSFASPQVLSPGLSIGWEILRGQPLEPFSLQALRPSAFLRLSFTDFDQVSMSLFAREKRECAQFLSTCIYLSSLPGLKTQRLSRAVEHHEYPPNIWLYKPGDREFNVYVVKEGRVDVQLSVTVGQGYRWPVDRHAWEVSTMDMVYNLTLKTCGSGEFFGEYELDRENKRRTGARTVTRTVCYVLPKAKLLEVFTAKEINELKAFGNLVIPSHDQCQSLVLQQFKAHKDYKQALITATSVDSSFPGTRDSLLDKRSKKLKKWVLNLQSRSNEKEQQVRQGIVQMRRDRIVVRSIDTLVATRVGSQEPMQKQQKRNLPTAKLSHPSQSS